jgi:NAD(P)-dependent dehydrogenase (short-subunit alcohol dehydrogenase family)
MQRHGKIIPLQADVTKKDDLAKIVTQITSTDGYINVLIANSGISGPSVNGITPTSTFTELRDALWSTSSADFTQTFEVNTTAVFFTVAAFLDLLDAGNKKGNMSQTGQVIVTSSIGGYNRIALAGFAYGTSKAATTHLVKVLATLLTPHGIRSNAIAPGCT